MKLHVCPLSPKCSARRPPEPSPWHIYLSVGKRHWAVALRQRDKFTNARLVGNEVEFGKHTWFWSGI